MGHLCLPDHPSVLGNILTVALRTLSDRMLGNVTTIITLTIGDIKCEVVSSIDYGKVYQLEILFLAKMVFKIDMAS